MPRFAANLSMLFDDVPFLDRFAAAAAAGFEGVECLFPYACSASDIAARLKAQGLKLVLFNLPAGDWDAGERGLAALPGRESEFLSGVDRALEYAEAVDCPYLHAPAGIVPPKISREQAWETYVANLQAACDRFARHGRSLLIEPINDRDLPGYLLNRSTEAVRAIERVDRPNIGLQLDLYHCQIMEGNLTAHLDALQPLIRHVQIAGVPGRHEPDVGEIHYPFVFDRLDALGYDGWVGCEYRPRGKTIEGLGWLPDGPVVLCL